MRLNTLWRRLISVILCGALMLSATIVVNAESYEAYNEQDTVDADISTFAIDQMLMVSQQWLSDTYGNNPSFGSVPIDGTSRRSTVNACIRALQIELGITNTADNFGSGTVSCFKAQYPNGVVQQEYPSTEESNVYGIIQCALWTKGYSTGASIISKHFYDGTGGAIKQLKEDMGFFNDNSTVTLEVMKALLSMDQFVLVSGGSPSIRAIQRSLNQNYMAYIGIIPTDGVYGRQMNKALIKVLQAIEGYSVSDATGNFGSGTKSKLPMLPDTSNILADDIEEKAIELAKFALVCNGYTVDVLSTTWDDMLVSKIKLFQSDMALQQTGTLNVDTWMALFLSKGNTDRAFTACDTNRPVTSDSQIQYLKDNGINVVGRYLSKMKKGITLNEIEKLHYNNISFFPIFQEMSVDEDITNFTQVRALQDSLTATAYGKNIGLPKDSIIYFAVDFDPVDIEIQQYVLPYFKSLYENIEDYYRIGIYGTRNVCSTVMDAGYAFTCFVSDSSTGYSGNMGFKMPNNWNFDQFDTNVNTNVLLDSGQYWYIDKVTYKGTFPAVTGVTDPDSAEAKYSVTEGTVILEDGYTIINGAGRLYNGRTMRIYLTLTGINGEVIDDGTKVNVCLYSLEDATEYDAYVLPLPQILLNGVTPDGVTYTNEDFDLYIPPHQFEIGGNPLIVNDTTHYYLKYSLVPGYKSPVKVKMKIEVA